MRLCVLLLALTACDTGHPLQLVTGHVRATGFDEVQGLAGSELVATAPVEEDGSFLLAVPAGELHLALAPADGGPPAVLLGPRGTAPLEVRICAPGAQVDLGRIRLEERFYEGSGCEEARRERRACIERAEASGCICTDLGCRSDGAMMLRCGAACEEAIAAVADACERVPAPPAAMAEVEPPPIGCGAP